ncbi:MAG: tRNA-dihydrouridine synthase, partial [Chryseobacterium sp.]|nr:tRNA-dihydrouridine synthase [Chryseobacterium sp.]
MLKKRIIPCLDIKNGRVVKGIQFEGLKDAGNPIELAEYYSENGADELVFLDISATLENRKTLAALVSEIAKKINIPFTVGGGINSLEDAKIMVGNGADKVSINSPALKNPNLITPLSNEFGSQFLVV